MSEVVKCLEISEGVDLGLGLLGLVGLVLALALVLGLWLGLGQS